MSLMIYSFYEFVNEKFDYTKQGNLDKEYKIFRDLGAGDTLYLIGNDYMRTTRSPFLIERKIVNIINNDAIFSYRSISGLECKTSYPDVPITIQTDDTLEPRVASTSKYLIEKFLKTKYYQKYHNLIRSGHINEYNAFAILQEFMTSEKI